MKSSFVKNRPPFKLLLLSDLVGKVGRGTSSGDWKTHGCPSRPG